MLLFQAGLDTPKTNVYESKTVSQFSILQTELGHKKRRRKRKKKQNK